MKRKEWLLLLLALVVCAGAIFGLITYRAGQQTTDPSEQKREMAAPQKLPEGPYAHLWITRDFGAETLQIKTVSLQQEDTVMDVLKRHAKNVETAYGGGFVQAIDGLASVYKPGDANSKKLDWFYSVNGVQADVGAGEYPVQTGDVIWWDYHDWSYAVSTPAQIGAFPKLIGTAPARVGADVVIMAAAGYEEKAKQLAAALAPVMEKPPIAVEWDEQKLQEEHAFLLIADKAKLVESLLLQSLWKEKGAFGLFAEPTQEGIQLYDTYGRPTRSFTAEDTGLLLATVHPKHRLPLLIVAGNGDSGVQLALDSLLAVPKDSVQLPWQGYFSTVISGKQKLRLPDEQAGGGQQ